MDAGRLTKRIDIYSVDKTLTDYGTTKESVNFKCSCRAGIDHNLGGRNIDNQEIFHNYSVMFNVRRFVKVTDADRIKYDGKWYRIISTDYNEILQQINILTELMNE